MRASHFGVIAAALMGTLTAAHAQDPLTLPGQNYRVVLENADVTVIRAHYGAHEKVPVHDHPGIATVFVYLSDSGPVKISHEGEGPKEFAVTRPPVFKGSYRVAPGMAERHTIENLGDLSSDFLRVELKHVSLKMEPFRGKAPESLVASADVIEFNNPQVKVERIICLPSAPCAVKPLDAPSLLVALTAFEMTRVAAGPGESVDTGSVQWLPSSMQRKVIATTGPAHLLRIILPPASE